MRGVSKPTVYQEVGVAQAWLIRDAWPRESPLKLNFRPRDNFLHLQRILTGTEIHYPPVLEQPENASAKRLRRTEGGNGIGGGQEIEKSLQEKGRVDVYGIHFDFDRDVLRPESEPVLRQIADAMNANPSWKLYVNGHTDSVGGDAHNLNLSNRRGAAVKEALVAKYQIDPSRLTPKRYGATQPKESNDTIEGRARNRRVELVRQ
jgi:outer membrane protein OmpA-like peptidoglycan-associated protein